MSNSICPKCKNVFIDIRPAIYPTPPGRCPRCAYESQNFPKEPDNDQSTIEDTIIDDEDELPMVHTSLNHTAIEKIKKRLQNITPFPWGFDGEFIYAANKSGGQNPEHPFSIAEICGHTSAPDDISPEEYEGNSQFIKHAPSDIQTLLNIIEQLQK